LARRRRFCAIRGERELVLCAAGPAQSEPAEPEDALEVGKQHLDALAVTARLLEGLAIKHAISIK
jgi:hypothetical protein